MTGPASPRGAARPIWLKVLIGFAFLVGAFNVAVFVYGLTLPGEWRVEESVEVAAPPAEIYPLVAAPGRWPEWTAWSRERDPSAKFKTEGPESGKDAALTWDGERLGFGRVTITQTGQDAEVGYSLELGGAGFSEKGRIRLEPAAGGTRVIWTDGGELEGTLGRLMGRRLERMVAADFAASLARLKEIAEQARQK